MNWLILKRKAAQFMVFYLFLLGTLIPFESLMACSTGLRSLPVQSDGRVKPFDTLARESLQLIYGRQKFNKTRADEVVFTWLLAPDEWNEVKLFQINHSGLKRALKLPLRQNHYTLNQLVQNERLSLVFQNLRLKKEEKEKLNPFDQAVQRLEHQIALFYGLRSGQSVRVQPPKPEDTTYTWQNVTELKGVYAEKFQNIVKGFVSQMGEKKEIAKQTEDQKQNLIQAVEDFKNQAVQDYGVNYAHLKKVYTEVHYNSLKPFMWAWILYLLGTLVLFKGLKWSFPFFMGGLFFHFYGLGLRIYIIERPPVTNMYESVVWVALGAMVLAGILYKFYQNRLLIAAGGIVATLSLILTDLSAQILDESLEPLEPVLRDNFWLMTHVLVITLSYAAFFLAFILGDILLFYYLKGEKYYKTKITQGVSLIYKSIQIGVVLLASGIILGGLWADVSWGRFWGWDPKETWALIALLGYIAWLHGRLAGWLKSFGSVVGAVLAFNLIIMAWYGVNFVLGAGLHTYGFGAGGLGWVFGFCMAHVIFVVYMVVLQKRKKRL